MPTDDVLSLIAEVRQLCDAMPSGPYTKIATLDFNEGFFTTLHLGTTEDDEYVHFGDQNQHHARYFASLDPTIVRALLDVVEQWANAENQGWVGGYGSALTTLRQLAADRVAS